jgi:hypothetical protein
MTDFLLQTYITFFLRLTEILHLPGIPYRKLVVSRRCKKSAFHSFYVSGARLWKQLSPDITSKNSLCVIKKQLIKILYEEL